MKRKGLTAGIILLFVGVAIAPSINFTVVNASNNDKRENEFSQKDLLFQTIVDIANNKDIQQVILKSQISREGFLNPDVKFAVFNTPVLTKNQLKQMYLVGLMLSKTISKSRMHSMVERYQVNNQWVQKEISAVIEKDVTLKEEIMQLSNSECDCGNTSETTVWHFPVICTILVVLEVLCYFLEIYLDIGHNFTITVMILEERFNCPGTP